MVDAHYEVGFWDGHRGFKCGLRERLQLLLYASPTAAKCSDGKVWSSWVEAEKFVEDDLELIVG